MFIKQELQFSDEKDAISEKVINFKFNIELTSIEYFAERYK